MSKFDIERVNQLIEISKLYYEDGLNQTDISKQVHIHRTEISRLLKEARELGIVKINIDSSFGASEKLSAEFQSIFHLKKAIIVPTTPGSSYSDDLSSIGMYAGNYLQQQLNSNNIVGLSWGRTLATVINSVNELNNISNITTVPLIGGPIGKLDVDYQANNLVHTLANRVKASTSYTLDSPVMISSPALRKELLDNPNNKAVTNFWKKLDIAIFGIGSSRITNNLTWRGFYKGTGFEDVLQGSAVGDILSQPFTIDGRLIKEANGSLVGMELSALKNIPLRIGVATGENKAEATLGALRSGTLNVLITSDKTAVAVKKLIN
ncbi:sugar-binding transcriptional regulator [Lactiplantibacillus mudanjiangensis]|uniref:Sorbitol operon regulator [Lactobacillus casei W56] n=1 Tax=Lactiplantibacillus mudanjiangensis TaxID=1296538 RepID=A0A660DV53_9LACO|nr:sugar-binding transcriptional regulator [Lactiplantibacillus mudanjiangensis]VDG22594.1 Sorbitol operon regulator [Lactobacillus casei W56] [Lactiplantibacillus mudanjiangensis]VDG26868.1 Sorbitol operon regulator [Lactobacillus casei W56] [Lactiplantibacillus mudanjiangensis]VDG32007.1 Sorbitol operon regulator [Lactobacillus casei W56] [Lactiplantibacillus mudanjiangensis]